MNGRNYTTEVGYEHRKKYAQFFTPPSIAQFMVDWVLHGKSCQSEVFDPAFGLGAFFESAPATCSFSGMDIDNTILDYYVKHSNKKPYALSCSDYLLSFGPRYRGIVCNPPYLRFQKFINRDKVFNTFSEKLGVRLSGYTNIASAFLIKSISELETGCRLAYIMPSEFLNAGYGSIVKEWLIRDGHLDSIIEITCEREAFEEVTTSICIILYDSSRQFDHVSFYKVESLSAFKTITDADAVCRVKTKALFAKDKWGKFFMRSDERVHPNLEILRPLQFYGHFSRGIATGANEFFVLTQQDIERIGLSRDAYCECVTKSCQIKKLIFGEDDFEKLATNGSPVFLFTPGSCPDTASRSYIKDGEEKGFNNRFITKHRTPWYKTEQRAVSPLLLNVFSRTGYKIVRNYSAARSLTNFHCFYPNMFGEKYIDWLFLYLQSSIGRKILSLSKRKYGNSLDKFEPNDLNGALVPIPAFLDKIGQNVCVDILNAIKHGEDVNDRLDGIFGGLVSPKESSDDAGLHVDEHIIADDYPRHSRMSQMYLPLEMKVG